MNDVSQRGIFAIFAILVVSGGVAYAAASGAAPSPSPALALRIPSAAALKIDARASDAVALDGDYGCASQRPVNHRPASNALVRAVSDCD
jgi:hypothetical protein